MAKKRIRIDDLAQARRVLVRTIGEFRNKEITSEMAKTIGYLINIYKSLYESSEIEKRLQKVVDYLEDRDHNGLTKYHEKS